VGLFEGRMGEPCLRDLKILDLSPDEAQYFIDVTGAKSCFGLWRIPSLM
jgi:hypothetical protein